MIEFFFFVRHEEEYLFIICCVPFGILIAYRQIPRAEGYAHKPPKLHGYNLLRYCDKKLLYKFNRQNSNLFPP
jgi:hypothetical protein